MTQGLELRGAVLGKGYRLGRRLDTNDTSAYEATHERLPGRFIIRVFPPESLSHPEASSRIQRGARVASLLRDPHSVQVLDCSVSGETPAFVVMERIPGRSLAEVMADDGMLPLSRVVEVVDSLAAALVAGHQLGLVHGDIRPAQVILPTSGQPAAKLSGFGWAKELRAAARLPAPSGYLAPEQQSGKVVTLDERTDQFGLAALAYDMIAACLPFSDDSGDAGDFAATRATPPAVSDLVPGVPRAVDEVLRRGLAPVPGERFSSISELAAALRQSAALTAEAAGRRVHSRAGAAARATGAMPGRTSSDVTEELELSSLSLVSSQDLHDDDLDDQEAATGERLPAASGTLPGDELVVEERQDDAELVLGATSSPAAPDDAKTQIVRSPFFEAADEGDQAHAHTSGAAAAVQEAAPFTTPRRGVPTGRPNISTVATTAALASSGATGDPGGVVAGPGTRRARRSENTQRGIGPTLTPGHAANGWKRLLKRGRWTFAGAAALGLATLVGAMVWMARDGEQVPQELGQSSPETGSPATLPAPAPPAASAAPTAAPVAMSPAKVPPPQEPATKTTVPAGDPPPAEAPARTLAAAQARGPQTPPAHPRGAIIARVDPLPEKTPPVAAAVQTSGARLDAPTARPPAPQARRPPTAKAPPLSSPSAASAAQDSAADECSIRISSRPWAEVWLDGKDTGRKTPIANLKVPCGTRKLELKRPDKDIEQMEMLEVVPGKPYRGSYELE